MDIGRGCPTLLSRSTEEDEIVHEPKEGEIKFYLANVFVERLEG